METIYTIPINEAFDVALEQEDAICPICALQSKLEEGELSSIVGGAMMESHIRIQTNELGFCSDHFHKLLNGKNRLALALIMESHLNTIKDYFDEGVFSNPGEKTSQRIGALSSSCYICTKVNQNLNRMADNVLYLYANDEGFQKKYANQKHFCLPHAKLMMEMAKGRLPKKLAPEFCKKTKEITLSYLTQLNEDVSWFCKKFDYRYNDEPWYNAKDSVERSVAFLCAEERPKTKKGGN